MLAAKTTTTPTESIVNQLSGRRTLTIKHQHHHHRQRINHNSSFFFYTISKLACCVLPLFARSLACLSVSFQSVLNVIFLRYCCYCCCFLLFSLITCVDLYDHRRLCTHIRVFSGKMEKCVKNPQICWQRKKIVSENLSLLIFQSSTNISSIRLQLNTVQVPIFQFISTKRTLTLIVVTVVAIFLFLSIRNAKKKLNV